MIVLGLTGSIGMGKSTVSEMFREGGVPVWDADAQVHHGYDGGGEEEERIYKFILANFPDACVNARVDRRILGEIVFGDPEKLRALEKVFGHYLEIEMGRFIAKARWETEAPMVVLDVPLLFENPHVGMQCHYVAVVHCSAEEQKRRVLARPGMTEERLKKVLAQQMPSAEKVKAADIRLDTSRPMLEVRQFVAEIIENIADEDWVARLSYDENGLL